MTPNETWATWRVNRLLKILELKAKGLTNSEVAEEMPISRSTVSRELNSPQAAEIGLKLRKQAMGILWPLVRVQIRQIEEDSTLTAGQKLIYRGKLINTLASLLPKQIEQKLEATGDLSFVLEAWRPDTEEESEENETE